MQINGRVEVWKVREGHRLLVHENHNTIFQTLYTNLRNVLISRSVEYGVDAVAWGSWINPAGSYIDSDWAGTTSSGTQGAFIQSAVGNLTAKYSGTFSFGATKKFNYLELGRGYTAAGPAVTQLFTDRYAYDDSLLTGSTFLTWESGDAMIVDWSIQVGS